MSNTFGSYFIIELIGAGGMAEVFLAAPLSNEKTRELPPLVALKKIRPEFSGQKPFVESFIAEAKLGALLEHPNIVRIYDLGVVGTELFFVMDWVDGKSFDLLLAKLKKNGMRLSERHIHYIFLQLVNGLSAAHAATDSVHRPLGIVHRDVTPGNILIGYDGSVKLTDFGLATAERAGQEGSKEVAFGKLPYMPPEQIQSQKIDQKADLYSLAVLLFQAITQRLPFEADTQVELTEKILQSEPVFEDEYFQKHPKVLNFLKRALAKKAAARPASTEEMKPFLASNQLEEGRGALEELMSSLFDEERAAEKSRIRKGLLEWDKLKREGADLLKDEDSFVEDLLSEKENVSGTVEKTEWIASAPLHQPTRVVFKQNQKETSANSIAKIDIQRKAVEVSVPRAKVVEEVVAANQPDEDEPIELDRPNVTKDIEAPKSQFNLPPIKPRTAQPREEFASFPEIPYRRSRPTLIAPIVIGALAVSVLIMTFIGVQKYLRSNAQSTLGPISEINWFVTVEGGADQRPRIWISTIRQFLASEHFRITKEIALPFTLSIGAIKENIREIDWRGAMASGPFDDLAGVFELKFPAAVQNRTAVFIHIYPKEFVETPKYPIDLQIERPNRVGMVFVPTNSREEDESIVRVTHEILHTLGATDKYDEKGRPRFPEGYVNSSQKPLYPQRFGEIMSRSILMSEINHRPLKSLAETRIGDETAVEIGWLAGSAVQR